MRFQIRVTEMLQPGHKIRTVGASDADVQKRPMQPIYALNLFNIANREEYLAAFDSYCQDSNLAGLHSHRVKGTADHVWHLFDRLEDLRPLLKAPGSD